MITFLGGLLGGMIGAIQAVLWRYSKTSYRNFNEFIVYM